MSQTETVLSLLRAGHTLTPLTALQMVGTLRLSERIRECERVIGSNERILHIPVKVGGKRVMSYQLERTYTAESLSALATFNVAPSVCTVAWTTKAATDEELCEATK
jgi:hypothetical protein